MSNKNHVTFVKMHNFEINGFAGRISADSVSSFARFGSGTKSSVKIEYVTSAFY